MNIDRLKEVIYAGALGDAFGYAVEFFQWSKIVAFFGEDGIQEFKLNNNKVIVSDDTQMTLYTLNAVNDYLENGSDLIKDFEVAYRDWYKTQMNLSLSRFKIPMSKMKCLHKRQAPGATCMTSLSKEVLGSIAYPINDSKGCGTIMRVAPIALIEKFSNEEAFQMAIHNAALTHGHPDGFWASGFYVVMLKELLNGKDFEEAISISKALLNSYNNTEHVVKMIDNCVELSKRDKLLTPEEIVKELGQGWVAEEALYVGLYSALVAKDFTCSLIIGANHSGDSDSTATLAGQLYAAKNGIDDNARDYIDKLDVKEAIDLQLDRLSNNIKNKKIIKP